MLISFSPVLCAPVRTAACGRPELEMVWSGYESDGRMARTRLKNVDEAAHIFGIVWLDSASDDGINSTSWKRMRRLLKSLLPGIGKWETS